MEYWFVVGGLILTIAVIAAGVAYRRRRPRRALDPSAAVAATTALRYRAAEAERLHNFDH